MCRLILLFIFGFSISSLSYAQQDYLDYHKRIIAAEEMMVEEKYNEALDQYEKVFSTYSFVFLRDYKVVCQLSAVLGQTEKVERYLLKGIAKGWSQKEIKKNRLLSSTYKKLNSENRIPPRKQLANDPRLRSRVHQLFKKDQKKALGALLRIGDKAQDRYGNRKFAPHSESQLAELNKILNEYGYPGEKLINNNFWASTILSHHNSISKKYVLRDTLYQYLKPKLLSALRQGEMSPFEYALISDWKTAVENNHQQTSYGFVGAINDQKTLAEIARNRRNIGLRSLEIRSGLLDIEKKTGMDFYLPGEPWQDGKIQMAGSTQ